MLSTRAVTDAQGRQWTCSPLKGSDPPVLECSTGRNKSPVLLPTPPDSVTMPPPELAQRILEVLGP